MFHKFLVNLLQTNEYGTIMKKRKLATTFFINCHKTTDLKLIFPVFLKK
jgi:hypothetical protein